MPELAGPLLGPEPPDSAEEPLIVPEQPDKTRNPGKSWDANQAARRMDTICLHACPIENSTGDLRRNYPLQSVATASERPIIRSNALLPWRLLRLRQS